MCDVDPAKAQAAAAEFDVERWYDDAAAMLENDSRVADDFDAQNFAADRFKR